VAVKLYRPRSLDRSIIERSWLAGNGELGILPEDVNGFLDACVSDSISVLGWEMWLVEHQWDGEEGAEIGRGMWTGLVPHVQGGTCCWQDSADAPTTRAQIANLEWRNAVPTQLHPWVRFNFTLDL
jgi:hypothetical protein